MAVSLTSPQSPRSTGAYHCFVVRDPKMREIFAPCFRDRLIHHLAVDRLAPLCDSQYIFDAHSNRCGKGTHTAVRRLQKFIRQSPPGSLWLHGDIKSYFTSINRKILFEIVKHRVSRLSGLTGKEKAQILALSFKTLNHNPVKDPMFTGNRHLIRHIPHHKSLFHQRPDVGLPIGSLTSQFFSNLYLDEFDQFCKHRLKIKRYIRYVDDFMIVGATASEIFPAQVRLEN